MCSQRFKPCHKWAELCLVSDTGMLVAQGGSQIAISQPLWFDRKGIQAGAVGKPDVYGNVSRARNGKSVVVDKTDAGSENTDVWTYMLQGDIGKRLTFDPAIDIGPIWSPDGARLAFSSTRQLNFDLYMKNSDGTQEEQIIVQDNLDKVPNDWSPDGKYILYAGGTDLWLVSIPELKNRLFLKAASVLKNGQFSPDGKWIAYASNETGKWEIYVRIVSGCAGQVAGLDGGRRTAPLARRRKRDLLSFSRQQDDGRAGNNRGQFRCWRTDHALPDHSPATRHK